MVMQQWDRFATEEPEYLYRLRNPGHWRAFNIWRREPRESDMGAALRHCHTLPPRRRVFLDAGCGHSPDALCAVKLLGFTRAIKIDQFPLYSHENHDWFRSELRKAEGRRVRFIQGDVCAMPLAGESVDMIGCNAMIDLLTESDRNLFYEESFRVLRSGGILAIYYQPLVNGYGWNGWREIRAMHAVGLERVNQGVRNNLFWRKP